MRACVHVEPEVERVVGRSTQPEQGGVGLLPVLETQRRVGDLVVVDRGPRGRVQVDERGLEQERTVGGVEETGAAGTPQELASGGRDEVGADRHGVEGELPDRLAGVEEVPRGGPRLPQCAPDLLGRVEQPVLARSVGDRDDLDPLVEQAPQRRRRRGLPIRRRARRPPRRPRDGRPPGRRARCSRTRRARRGCGRPRPSGIDRNPRSHESVALVVRAMCRASVPTRLAARGIDGVDPGGRLVMRLVAADLGLATQVRDHRVDHDLRRQGRSRVVEVVHARGARRVGAQPGQLGRAQTGRVGRRRGG